MPLYDMYKDDTTDAECGLSGSPEDDDTPVMSTELDRNIPTPEANDNYLNDSVMFQRRNTNDRVNVIVRKRYSDGNSIGRTNDNPILDTRKYRTEFDDGEVSEIMANVIAESMYAACNDDGNEYLMM